MVKNTNCDALHGSQIRLNAIDVGMQPLRDILMQSAGPKLDVVFFPNRLPSGERIVLLHRQTKPLLQPKDLPTLSRCLNDAYKHQLPL